MASYAAVVSFMHLMEQIQVYHAQHPIFRHKQQRQLESLGNKTLIVESRGMSLPSEIWEMSQLRHIKIGGFTLDDPCAGKSENIVLENLQTLSGICDFRCSEEVLRKIPNVKKLSMYDYIYTQKSCINKTIPFEYLKNLSRLTRLESLKGFFSGKNSHSALEYSSSLKKLHLNIESWDWEDIGGKVGLLPHLEKFTLYYTYGGEEWNLVEGQFPRLKYLFVSSRSLKHWTVDSTPFPCLEHLHLMGMEKLEEIPLEIGDIPTLRSIEVSASSSDSAIDSAMMIQDEQRSFGNEDLLVEIISSRD